MKNTYYRLINEFLKKIINFIDWKPVKMLLEMELKKGKSSAGVVPYTPIKNVQDFVASILV